MQEVLIEKQNYFFKGKQYNGNEIEYLRRILDKNINICILGESILVNKINKRNLGLKECLENYEKGNIFNEDTLFHYEYDKKENNLFIYSIKQGQQVLSIAKELSRIKVYPIQFKAIKFINKKVKCRNYKAVFQVRQYIYIIEVMNRVITYSNTYYYQDFIIENFIELTNGDDRLIIDESIYLKYKNTIELSDEKIKVISYEGVII